MDTDHARRDENAKGHPRGCQSVSLAVVVALLLLLGGAWLGVMEVSLGIAPAGTRGLERIEGYGPSGSTEVVALWRAEIRFHSRRRRPRP